MPPQVAEKIPGLSSQAVVQIEIRDGQIHVYPQRAAETIIYNVAPGVPAKGRPSEVRWVVSGLPPQHSVHIVPKDDVAKGMFTPKDELVVAEPDNTITSGCPKKNSGHGQNLVWNYTIILMGPNGEVRRLDPGIIIKDYP
jgi:hypothetical protein